MFMVAICLIFITAYMIGNTTTGNATCSNGELRLAGGTHRSGRVEICFNGRWGTVCDNLWSDSDAAAVCRELGLPSLGAVGLSRAYFGQGTGPVFISSVNCAETNGTNFSSCYNMDDIGRQGCGHSLDISVVCTG